MQTLWASIVVFGLLIFFHEFGHFIVAKLAGIKVHEFSLGFGPRLAGLPRGETTYNLRLLPLGGFVRMAGMDPEDKEADDERGFNKKPVWQRALVIVAGPLMNFLLAALLLAVIFAAQGMPAPTTTVSKLLPGQPAEKAGLRPGDRIVAIDGQPVQSWEQISQLISGLPDRRIDLTVVRNQNRKNITLVTARDPSGQGKIGIYPSQEMQRMGLFTAVGKGMEYTARISVLILDFIGKMITGRAPAELGGPVRIVQEIHTAVGMGIFYLLQLAAFLSINLGLFNLLPIPALDGSRVVFLAVEGLRGRPVDPAKENFIHLVGFGLLLLLIVVITYNDVLQIM
ncbi:RIP metalloprotease RseP [Desulfotomaculum copahuensis]|uniref:Zinc metalloprotease n=1 Tax=Desulfotomaculum copahuensis TaxID=1838280 RepID=A0A1B7LHS9_9FIRM|nr:RIP metalloprotease RseP [Desulfotomaculum copahuensis]OAT85861.1 RIP metalloprotease RseP [Desulfotomaculum copahuensis]